MLKLREFDLQFAFTRSGALRENVENERRAVEDFAVKNLFKIAALCGRKLVIENHRVHVLTPAEIREFSRLAFANERGGIQRFRVLQAVTDDFTTGGHSKFAEFGKRIEHGRTVARFEFDGDEEDPFRPFFSGFYESFQCFGGNSVMTSALTPANPHPPALRYGAVQVYSRVEAKRRRKEREFTIPALGRI